jgi:hypothetical protein
MFARSCSLGKSATIVAEAEEATLDVTASSPLQG